MDRILKRLQRAQNVRSLESALLVCVSEAFTRLANFLFDGHIGVTRLKSFLSWIESHTSVP
eukprot:5952868-Pleurochrysis_carterae.AAC.2